jgi:hypothetical protein
MGRPIGSVNRQKPFADALRMEICAGNDPRHLRAIARKQIEISRCGACVRLIRVQPMTGDQSRLLKTGLQ